MTGLLTTIFIITRVAYMLRFIWNIVINKLVHRKLYTIVLAEYELKEIYNMKCILQPTEIYISSFGSTIEEAINNLKSEVENVLSTTFTDLISSSPCNCTTNNLDIDPRVLKHFDTGDNTYEIYYVSNYMSFSNKNMLSNVIEKKWINQNMYDVAKLDMSQITGVSVKEIYDTGRPYVIPVFYDMHTYINGLTINGSPSIPKNKLVIGTRVDMQMMFRFYGLRIDDKSFIIDTVDLSNQDVTAVTNINCLFEEANIRHIKLNNWNLSSCEQARGVFRGCDNTETIELNRFKVNKNADISDFCQGIPSTCKIIYNGCSDNIRNAIMNSV